MIRALREATEWVLIHIGTGALALLGLWEWSTTGLAPLRPLWSRFPGTPPADVTFFLCTGGPGVGLLLGLGQALSGRLAGAPVPWILRSGLGGGLALLLPWGLFWAIGPERVLPPGAPELYAFFLVFGVSGASLGLGVGLAQWTLLRGMSRAAWAWLILTAFGGLVAGWGMAWWGGTGWIAFRRVRSGWDGWPSVLWPGCCLGPRRRGASPPSPLPKRLVRERSAAYLRNETKDEGNRTAHRGSGPRGRGGTAGHRGRRPRRPLDHPVFCGNRIAPRTLGGGHRRSAPPGLQAGGSLASLERWRGDREDLAGPRWGAALDPGRPHGRLPRPQALLQWPNAGLRIADGTARRRSLRRRKAIVKATWNEPKTGAGALRMWPRGGAPMDPARPWPRGGFLPPFAPVD
jgi:hypothetical protein